MAVRSKSDIKNFFTTGSIPSASNYADLMDTNHITHDIVDGKDTGVVIETRGNDRVIKINVDVINSLIDKKVGTAGTINNSLITIQQPFAPDSTFRLNQNSDRVITIVFPNGNITVKGNEQPKVINKCNNVNDEIEFSRLAFTGRWEDLINRPVIPDSFNQVQSDWNQMDVNAPNYILNKPVFANGQLFLLQNGVNVGSYAVDSDNNIINGYRFTPETQNPTYYEIMATDWDANEGAANELKNKPLFAKVAYTGNYNDLLYNPSSVNNSTIKIYRNKEQGYDSLFSSTEGSGASATATLKVSVVRVEMIDNGSGYTSGTPPIVTFSDPDTGGVTATGVAIVTPVDGQVVSISNINVNTNKGYSFANPPTVTIAAPTSGIGRRATGVPILEACLDTITVTNGGGGYNPSAPPKITIAGGAGATAVPVINSSGQITSITITNNGYAFNDNAEIIIGGAPIIFTLNQPNSDEFDLELGLAALTNNYEHLEHKPTIGAGELTIRLNSNDLNYGAEHFNANITTPIFVNINAATHITLTGDIITLSERIPVDQDGLFNITTALKDIDITIGPNDELTHTYNGQDLIFDVLHGWDETINADAQSFKVDTKGRVTSYKSRKYRLRLPNVVISGTGDVTTESGTANNGNILLNLILKAINTTITTITPNPILTSPINRTINIPTISDLVLDTKGRVTEVIKTNYDVVFPNVLITNDLIGTGTVNANGDIEVDVELRVVNPILNEEIENITCPTNRVIDIPAISSVSIDPKGRFLLGTLTTYTITIPNVILENDVIGTGSVSGGNIIINSVLKTIPSNQTTTYKSYNYSDTEDTIELTIVDKVNTDTRGRVIGVETTVHIFPNYLSEIQDHENRLITLEAIGGKWIGFNFNTFANLNSYVKPPALTINDGDYTYVINDETKLHPITSTPQLTLYRWVDTGFIFSHVVKEDPIGRFTNTEFGVIKGEPTKPGYVNAQSDGTGKVNILPIILDYDNNTKTLWLDGELPAGYTVYGFNKGVVSAAMDLTLINSDMFSYTYVETNTSVLNTVSWTKFYVFEI